MRRAILFAILLAGAASLAAQTSTEPEAPAEPTWQFTLANLDFGLQRVDSDVNSSKLREYRDLPNGVVVPSFRIFGQGTWRFSLMGQNVQQRDQQYGLTLWNDKMNLKVDYNQIPHRFGNDARTLLEPTSRDRLEISDTLQQAFQNAIAAQWAISKPGVNYAFLRDLVAPSLKAANRFDLSLLRKRGTLDLGVKTGPADVHLTYFQEMRNGTRAAGTSFGFGDVVETPEPISFRTEDLGLSAEIPLGGGLVRGAVHLNQFSNKIGFLTWDNPFRATDATDASAYTAPGAISIAGASTGRLDLPPDSKALTGSLGFLFHLPARSRVSADFSLSDWTQNRAFMPYSTNTAITTPLVATDLATLPERSLDGKVKITTGNIAFISRPIPKLGLTARYRLYDLNNETRRIEFPGYVRFDAVWEPIERISVPYEFKRNTTDLTASYDMGPATLEGGYRREVWNRPRFRESNRTSEGVWRVAADVRPLSWALLRASVETGSRNNDGYDNERGGGASFPEPESTNLPSLRRYDEAEKDITRYQSTVQLTPGGNMSVSLNYVYNKDDYNKSEHGLIYSKNNSLNAEADYSPSDRWNAYVFYTVEGYRTFQRSRQSGATLSIDPLADWSAKVKDDVDTFGAGANFNVVPDKVSLKLLGRYQKVDGFNELFSPPGGVPDVAFSIANFDDTELWSTNAEVTWKMLTNWDLAVGAWVEDYSINDAQTTGVTSYMPSAFFLAANDADYHGNVAYFKAILHY